MSDASEIIFFLHERLDELEKSATSDAYGAYEFFNWVKETSGQLVYSDQRNRTISPQEMVLLGRAEPYSVLAHVRMTKQLIDDCSSALVYVDVPGMEGAAVLAQRTLKRLAAEYGHHPKYLREWAV